jgi:gamma-glutamylaminecyclotransferase
MREVVFVYGTLMHEQPNHRVLVRLGARRLGGATTTAARTLVDLGPYPALLPIDPSRDATASRVTGELYALEALGARRARDALDALDAFEGCPDLYRRERIAVEHEGVAIDAWTYVLARNLPPHAVIVATGRYAGGGIVLERSARDADSLDKSAKISDVSPPRKPKPR